MKFNALLAGLLALSIVPAAAAEAIWITNVKLVSSPAACWSRAAGSRPSTAVLAAACRPAPGASTARAATSRPG